MKIGSAYPSTYLKADDLNGTRPVVTIRSLKMEDIGGDEKPVLYFEGKDKGLVLNKTNANAISDIVGSDETEDWVGQRIRLYTAKVDFQGRRVPAIRVEEAPASRETVAKAQAKPVATEYADDGRSARSLPDEDLDVPF